MGSGSETTTLKKLNRTHFYISNCDS